MGIVLSNARRCSFALPFRVLRWACSLQSAYKCFLNYVLRSLLFRKSAVVRHPMILEPSPTPLICRLVSTAGFSHRLSPRTVYIELSVSASVICLSHPISKLVVINLDMAMCIMHRSMRKYEAMRIIKTWCSSWATSSRMHEDVQWPCLYG